jgi:hypothetical protein
MISADGWFDWAERDPGPADKRYSAPCLSSGVVLHSAVGFYPGWRSRLDSKERDPNDPSRYSAYAAASVTGWVAYGGALIQHYPIDVSCWASGNGHANIAFNAFEHDGGYPNESEPLREAQIATDLRIIRELSALKGWTFNRGAPDVRTAWEHHECVEVWGGGSTSCPDNRIPWDEIARRLGVGAAKEEDMADFIGWFCWAKTPREQARKPFRSYRILIGPDGPYKVHDADAAHFNAMTAVGQHLQEKDLATLKAIPSAPGTPEPDAG